MKNIFILFSFVLIVSCEILESSDIETDPFIGTWLGWVDRFNRISTFNIYSDGTYIVVEEPAPAVNDLDSRSY